MWSMLFFMLGFAIIAGLFVGIAFGTFIFFYSMPYQIWRAFYYAKDNPSAKSGNSGVHGKAHLMLVASNSTKLYYSWITKKPHNITKF